MGGWRRNQQTKEQGGWAGLCHGRQQWDCEDCKGFTRILQEKDPGWKNKSISALIKIELRENILKDFPKGGRGANSQQVADGHVKQQQAARLASLIGAIMEGISQVAAASPPSERDK